MVFVTWVALLLVTLAGALLVAGCGSSDSEGDTSESPASTTSDILRVASLYSVTTWDPSASYSTEVMYMANCYEPLVYANPAGSEEPFSPGLATEWTAAPDGLSWTFKLREGVTFHDGTPFNADAAKYSIDRTMELNLGAAYLLSPIKEVKVVDEYTIEFVLSDPAPIDRIMSGDYAVWMFSPATEGKDQAWWDKGNEAGTGPYVLESYTADQEAVFTANPDWWGGWEDNQFKKVVVQFVGDAGTQRQLLESGAVDTINQVARDQVDALKANPDLVVYTGPSLNSYLMFFNTQRKPLDNEKVRQALSYAVPYEDLIAIGAGGYGTQSRGPVPIDLWPNTDGTVRQYSTDFEKAKQLLSEAGYPGGGFTLELTYTSENSNEAAYVPLIKEAFAKVGVTVDIKALLNTADAAKARGPGGSPGSGHPALVAELPRRRRQPRAHVRLRGRSGLQLVLLVQRRVRQARGRGVQAERHRSGGGAGALRQGPEHARRPGDRRVPVRRSDRGGASGDGQVQRLGDQLQLPAGAVLDADHQVTW